MNPAWLDVAEKELGVHELSGKEENSKRILEYASCTSLKAKDDETAWCSAFVNWCFTQVRITPTNSAAARSWLTWGETLKEPRVGCVVVLRRGAPPSGHVGFVIGFDATTLSVLGGNQGDKVKISHYRRQDVLGYRWPKGVK